MRKKLVIISFGKGGTVWVRAKGVRKQFDCREMNKAIGFACGLRFEERDQPCLLLPPNALNGVMMDNSSREAEWRSGADEARQRIAGGVA